MYIIRFGGLGVACWPLVPKFACSNPAEAVRIFRAKKILSTHSFEGEVKPLVPCRRFAARKRSLNGVEVVISAKLPDNSRPTHFHLLLLGSVTSLRAWRHLAAEVGTSKKGGG